MRPRSATVTRMFAQSIEGYVCSEFGAAVVSGLTSASVSDFGTLVDGTETVADVQDLLANWDPRMAALNAQAVGLDPDILTDLAALTNRYNSAAGAAKKAISDTGWDPVPVAMRPMQSAYDAILGALKQVPGTITKGDYDDVNQRVTEARAAIGQHTDVPTVQPTTVDGGMGWYKALAPYDIIAQIKGDEAPKVWPLTAILPGAPPDPLRWLETAIALASIGLGGIFAFRLFVAPAIKTVAWLAGTVAGGYVAYNVTQSAGTKLGQIETSTAGKALGL